MKVQKRQVLITRAPLSLASDTPEIHQASVGRGMLITLREVGDSEML